MNGSFHRSRREQFYKHLKDGEALILFAGAPPKKTADAHYRFFANRNFYYMSGILQTGTVFFAVNRGGEIEESLFLHKKDPMAERWNGRRLTRKEASEQSGVEQIKELDQFERELKAAINGGEVTTIWYDFDRFDVGSLDAPQNRHSASLRSEYPALDFKNAYAPICLARSIKAPEEIATIKDAMCVTRDGIHAMMQAAKPDMYEYQLEAVFNKVLADAGVRESAFANIVSGGRNNFYIHYEEPSGILKDGDLILTDVGARKNEYANDISRAFPVNGRFSPEQKDVYSIALSVSKELMGLLAPGAVTFADIEAHARKSVREKLVSAGFLNESEPVTKYYWHNGTHHLGLDVHDVGTRQTPIETGMVFTIDVGIYIEDKNIGFRIEDDVVITPEGYENLSIEIVREVDDVEAMMAG